MTLQELMPLFLLFLFLFIIVYSMGLGTALVFKRWKSGNSTGSEINLNLQARVERLDEEAKEFKSK
ncbi:hypothetical protein SAMN05421743_102143 [Thalassobacillus cyri]|uniref:Uncharacterized protein n=1 Tax=Thalassobacillus cyri TaxID=571932 RepID=A0A1H3XI99_9BACI|nr:hypothetical protein [Thalassobacillus cyri]SDZ98364.1 hypothetical protein SAMN05421743_102143 [Thalassobacillus cyri]